MRNNNNGLRVIAGGLSNEEYQARQLRKEDLAVWGTPDTWDEEIVWHMIYDADDYELERFLDYLEEDDDMSEVNAPQLYAINSDEDEYECRYYMINENGEREEIDEDMAYLEIEVSNQELLMLEKEMEESARRYEQEMAELEAKLEESTGLIRRFIKKVFGA